MKHLLFLLIIALQAAPAVETATVEGAVFTLGTNDPLAGATVGLIPNGSGRAAGPRATSDAEGKFRFANLKPGRYELIAERSGLLKPHGATGGPSTLNLIAGQTLKDLRIHLTPGLIITGKVSSDSGAPLQDIEVMASRVTYHRSGVPMLQPCTATTNARANTDERGEYRLFGLEPGTYYVSAAMKRPVGTGMFGPLGRDNTCVTAFYPGAIDLADAVPVVLRARTDASGIDIRLPQPTLHKATFKVDAAPGLPTRQTAPLFTITKISRNGVRVIVERGAPGTFAGGVYTSPGLPAGSYEIEHAQGVAINTDMARVRFSIVDRDVDAGRVVIYPPLSVTGQVKTDGPMPTGWKLTDLKVDLYPFDVREVVAVRGASVSSDGKFSTVGTSQGRFQLYSLGLNENLYFASAMRDGRDILDGGIVIDGPDPISLAITVRLGGQVEGIVRNAKDEPVPDSLVALVPSPNLRGNLLLFKSVTSDQDGRFSLTGVAPGEYSVFAWDHADPNAPRSPEFLKEFEARGSAVRVTAGSSSNANVRVIASSVDR
jgi:hypothetical protein